MCAESALWALLQEWVGGRESWWGHESQGRAASWLRTVLLHLCWTLSSDHIFLVKECLRQNMLSPGPPQAWKINCTSVISFAELVYFSRNANFSGSNLEKKSSLSSSFEMDNVFFSMFLRSTMMGWPWLEASLSLASSTRQGRKSIMKGSWGKTMTGKDHSDYCQTKQTWLGENLNRFEKVA